MAKFVLMLPRWRDTRTTIPRGHGPLDGVVRNVGAMP